MEVEELPGSLKPHQELISHGERYLMYQTLLSPIGQPFKLTSLLLRWVTTCCSFCGIGARWCVTEGHALVTLVFCGVWLWCMCVHV